MSGKDVKIMTTLHGTDITVLGYDHSLKNAIKFGIEESDIVTSVSRSFAQQTYEIIDTDKEIVPIYNFVRENEFPTCHNEELKESYGIAPEEKVLIHVSISERSNVSIPLLKRLRKYVNVYQVN